jgi:hypothetical protein
MHGVHSTATEDAQHDWQTHGTKENLFLGEEKSQNKQKKKAEKR